MAYDARRASPMASTTVAAPVRTSPEAKIFGTLVRKMCSSATRLPRRSTSSPARISSGSVSIHDSSGPWPMAPRTVSHSTMNSVPGIGSGRRRPCASGSPSFMRWNSTPLTLPFSPVTMRVGAAWKMRRAPSSMASCASSAAGMSLRSRR